MSEYIERQAAIDAVKKNAFRLTVAEEQNAMGHVAWKADAVYSDAMEGALYELPSADVVPVVRCKDCVHFLKLRLSDGYWCDNDYGMCDDDPNGFCSHGKRREE